jgi:hypothetical protein
LVKVPVQIDDDVRDGYLGFSGSTGAKEIRDSHGRGFCTGTGGERAR